MDSWGKWAKNVFGEAELGDTRRTKRLVKMAAQAGRCPSGRISKAFASDAERQGAYDFIESPLVNADAIRQAVTSSTARRSAAEPWVYVPLDGTSIKLWDGTGQKDFGAIGTYTSKAAGLKLNNAMAINAAGTPIGIAAQVWWRRPRERTIKRHRVARRLGEKETRFLLEAVDQVCTNFARHAPDTRCWFQIDRGGDARDLLRHLVASGHWFTVRSQHEKRIVSRGHQPQYLWESLRKQPVLGYSTLELPRTEKRAARTARLVFRSAQLVVRLRNRWTKQHFSLPINAVLVREIYPSAGDGLEWLLLTNRPVSTLKQAQEVVKGYTQRWRIEEYHKTWKTGVCDVENTQLHSSDRVIRWATLLSAVAARIERLKYLSRTEPEAPATTELTESEIEALKLLRIRRGKRGEHIPKQLTISQATQWIAELGGYTGKSSGGPPGTITIGRGLERLQPAAELYQLMRGPPK